MPTRLSMPLLLIATTTSLPVLADGMADHTPEWDLALKASTLGLGVEVRRSFGPSLALRGAFNSYGYDIEEEIDNVEYDGDLELQSGGLLADWHPFENGFRVTGGLYLNGTELQVDAQPSGGSFEFDGVTYTAAEVGSAQGDAEFDTLSPYVGIGWGRAFGSEQRFSVSIDAGVLFQGQPSFDLQVTCGSAVPAPRCVQLQADVADEKEQFEDDAEDFATYPVLSLGLSYRVGGD